MKIIDLTQTLEEGMPVYPGTEPPILAEANTIDRDGFREKKITMFSHTGTHIDAPAHILPGAATLDSLPVDSYYGSACVLDLPGDSSNPGVSGEALKSREAEISGVDFLLLRTGWDRHWGEDEYFDGFPVLDRETADWLAGLGLKGIGIDAISVDPAGSVTLPIHHILLGAGLVIVENLTNLDQLPAEGFLFSCLPLKIRDADGSPVRAVAQFL